MHELPVTESVLEIALRHAKGAGAERITNIYLVIGQLSSIVDDSIQFYWDIVSKDSRRKVQSCISNGSRQRSNVWTVTIIISPVESLPAAPIAGAAR